MALLNKKERIIDLVLTNRGREQLSKNQLNFSYYAFSDEGVDYSGSLSVAGSASLDNYLHRNLAFEATQRVGDFEGAKRGPIKLDLNSFLYTIPAGKKVLPEFVMSVDESTEVNIIRRFLVDQLILHARRRNRIRRPYAVIMRASIPKKTFMYRLNRYVSRQYYRRTRVRLKNGKSVVGYPIGENLVMLNNRMVLDTVTGAVFPVSKIQPTDTVDATGLKKEIEVVLGRDTFNIDLKLKSSEGEIEPSNGFLVEIFESGSNGKLTKVAKKNIEDPLNDDVLKEGFDSFLNLKIDRK